MFINIFINFSNKQILVKSKNAALLSLSFEKLIFIIRLFHSSAYKLNLSKYLKHFVSSDTLSDIIVYKPFT